MNQHRAPSRRLRVPRHRGTTAHVCSAYPFLAEPGLGARGVYIGTNVLTGGGGFAYDPFTAYADGVLTNPNVIVAGDVGMGKSTAVKCFVHRSVAMFGRWVAIADPKGEYLPLAEMLGLTVLELHPGGTTRLNPLDPTPLGGTATDETARRQAELLAARPTWSPHSSARYCTGTSTPSKTPCSDGRSRIWPSWLNARQERCRPSVTSSK